MGCALRRRPRLVSTHRSCTAWSEIGECLKNPDFMKVDCRLSCGVCQAVPINPTTTSTARTTTTSTARTNLCKGFHLWSLGMGVSRRWCVFLSEVSGLVPCTDGQSHCSHYLEDGPYCPAFTTWAPIDRALRYTDSLGVTHVNPLDCRGEEVSFGGTYVAGTIPMFGTVRNYTVCHGTTITLPGAISTTSITTTQSTPITST